jgi:hypothetical protein
MKSKDQENLSKIYLEYIVKGNEYPPEPPKGTLNFDRNSKPSDELDVGEEGEWKDILENIVNLGVNASTYLSVRGGNHQWLKGLQDTMDYIDYALSKLDDHGKQSIKNYIKYAVQDKNHAEDPEESTALNFLVSDFFKNEVVKYYKPKRKVSLLNFL